MEMSYFGWKKPAPFAILIDFFVREYVKLIFLVTIKWKILFVSFKFAG